MGKAGDEVLTLAEAAEILRISVTTAKIEAAAGRLPAFKAGRAWRITRANLDRYMAPVATPRRAKR